ncbi:hypothetical protein SLEP1_g17086 [Rubroshorea leprosula]|uniref:Uncharacterized protein n=1 Tax=Rubroshorea leprosula TaxID=152421 RepID=A0AAV5IT55_9ROSI|nr:hypothetical protein SLEP1_g17086 [Rubroshorea leprosula]
MYTTNESEDGPQLRSNMFSLSGTGFFGAVGRSINLGGQSALALRLLLAVFSSKISSDVNRPFGDEVVYSNILKSHNTCSVYKIYEISTLVYESLQNLQFRAARKASEEVGAQIVLGDRPIEITLERAWNSLKWAEKVSLVRSVIRGITSSSDISRNDLEVFSCHCLLPNIVLHFHKAWVFSCYGKWIMTKKDPCFEKFSLFPATSNQEKSILNCRNRIQMTAPFSFMRG